MNAQYVKEWREVTILWKLTLLSTECNRPTSNWKCLIAIGIEEKVIGPTLRETCVNEIALFDY